ncbi:MAG TPA: ribosome biogenesis GTPase Der [Nitrospiria bacterium]|nr:ribosome biogenesis GTPase Der [Nitrospiria bacterium]
MAEPLTPLPAIAILGRPNVGKSTFFNRIIGRRAAIVEDLPGVTRDRHYATTDWRGRSFRLIDTGGLDPEATTGMLALVRRQTEEAINEADVLICLFDGRDGLTPLDELIVEKLRKQSKPVFYAVNKTDTAGGRMLVNEFYRLGISPLYPISAEEGQGVAELLDEAAGHLPERAAPPQADDAPKIAILGRPNVGKSTLLNALTGEERAVVDSTPGTTRDTVDELVLHQNRPYLFVDTAGIRRRGKIDRGVERYSVARALDALERCDVALLVIDASEGIVDQETKLAGRVIEAGKGLVLLINKWDTKAGVEKAREAMESEIRRLFPFIPDPVVLYTSGLTKRGVNKIFGQLDRVLDGCRQRITTGQLNRLIRRLMAKQPPPTDRGRPVKLYYLTQGGVKPPTFVLFTNRPKGITPSYLRFIEHQLRAQYGFFGTPIRFLVKLREREPRGKPGWVKDRSPRLGRE